MEDLVNSCFNSFYSKKRVLVTGHSGFKGSWLACWLDILGAEVFGISKDKLSAQTNRQILEGKCTSYECNVNDFATLDSLITSIQPQIVFHLAAQPLVLASYQDPLETWNTNVIGTANLLHSCRQVDSLEKIIVITSDKVYRDLGDGYPHSEGDELGGVDPYSASKACQELVTRSFREAFFANRKFPNIFTARAGNVIGGGDWAQNRLLPDIVKSTFFNEHLKIRHPNAVRPWQHVLDAISGYLMLGWRVSDQTESNLQSEWNFGPLADDQKRVLDIIHDIEKRFASLIWTIDTPPEFKETSLLTLNSSKAYNQLGWRNIYSAEEAIEKTLDWYEAYCVSQKTITVEQICNYCSTASNEKLIWACP
jgi:CDP-glucose 4,6-dehydratase